MSAAIQIPMFDITQAPDPRDKYGAPDLATYDKFVVFISGGVDSTACILELLEAGVPRDNIELHHHLIDGHDSEGADMFDWPVTESYCRKLAEALGLPIFMSWKKGGLLGEIMRNGERTKPAMIQTPEGDFIEVGGTRGKESTRLKFPAVSADLSTRFCSSYGKIDIGAKVLTSHPRFNNKRTLVITGEMAVESLKRSTYMSFEPHRTDRRNSKKLARHIDHWRPLLKKTKAEAWEILERWKVRAHPSYELGFGRCSCQFCIFGSVNQWATLRAIDPVRFERIYKKEKELNHTINAKYNIHQLADMGKPYEAATPDRVMLALSKVYYENIIDENWTMPAGATGEQTGPG